jgi:hypothetical protein
VINWIDPAIDCTPTILDSWVDIDLDDYIPALGADVTGVLLRIQYGTGKIGFRKKGSTDNRIQDTGEGFCGAAVGVDADHKFQAYVGHIGFAPPHAGSLISIYGYTTTNTVFFTDAINKTLGVSGAWTDIDCSIEAPGAIALIFEVYCNIASGNVGFRKKGSTDDRVYVVYGYDCFTAIIGCDGSQVCQGNASKWQPASIFPEFRLVGYVTADVVMNTNAPDRTPPAFTGFQDAQLSVPPLGKIATGGFIEVCNALADPPAGVRKKGWGGGGNQNEFLSWNFVPCDINRYIQTYRAVGDVETYWESGITLADAPSPSSASGIRAAHKKLLLGGA